MEIVPPIAEKRTFCIRFAFQKAGSVPDFVFLCNVALIGNRVGSPAIPRPKQGFQFQPVMLFLASVMKKRAKCLLLGQVFRSLECSQPEPGRSAPRPGRRTASVAQYDDMGRRASLRRMWRVA
jgi:hypothetical protein